MREPLWWTIEAAALGDGYSPKGKKKNNHSGMWKKYEDWEKEKERKFLICILHYLLLTKHLIHTYVIISKNFTTT